MVEPYELPKKFAGYVIAWIRCPICDKDFTTCISVTNFYGGKGGSFLHYPEAGGCGAVFVIISSENFDLKVSIIKDGKQESTGSIYIGPNQNEPSVLYPLSR